MRTLCLASTLLIVALAGCLDAPDDLNDDSYTLTADGAPGVLQLGESFTFSLEIDGGLALESDHIGAHYWTTDVADPDASFGDQAGACQHQASVRSVPTTVDVTCTFASSGTYYLRGHMRITTDEAYNFWTDSHRVMVVDYGLEAKDTFMQATVGESSSFNLTITGNPLSSSDHIGAHYWDAATEDPSGDFSDQAGACMHQTGTKTVPGTFQVDCTFSEAGTYHVYGHLRLTSGGSVVNFWADGFAVTVS